MRKFLALFFTSCIFLLGCAQSNHTGKVLVRDEKGNILKQYEIVLDRPMQMSITDGDIIIEGDSRGKGIIESLSMSLGLYKGDSSGGYYGYEY